MWMDSVINKTRVGCLSAISIVCCCRPPTATGRRSSPASFFLSSCPSLARQPPHRTATPNGDVLCKGLQDDESPSKARPTAALRPSPRQRTNPCFSTSKEADRTRLPLIESAQMATRVRARLCRQLVQREATHGSTDRVVSGGPVKTRIPGRLVPIHARPTRRCTHSYNTAAADGGGIMCVGRPLIGRRNGPCF